MNCLTQRMIGYQVIVTVGGAPVVGDGEVAPVRDGPATDQRRTSDGASRDPSVTGLKDSRRVKLIISAPSSTGSTE